MIDYSNYIPEETKEIKNLVNKIFNHTLFTGENEKWIMHREPFREGFSDGGCIDFYELEHSVPHIVHIIKKLQHYKPKTILEIGMNVCSFAIVSKLVLDDVKIYSIDWQPKFEERKNEVNNFFGEELITSYIGKSDRTLCRNWVNQRSYDLAWIDGKHDKVTAMYDVMTAYYNNIPIIMCDNYDEVTGVKPAIETLKEYINVKDIDINYHIFTLQNLGVNRNVIFGYDRLDDNFFVPNGYPSHFKWIEDIVNYKEEYGVEKVVHNLFREFQTNQKLVDDIKGKFLYPVEQFGAFDKLIGKDENYKDFCFLKNIKPSTLKRLQSGEGKIVVFALEESRVELEEMTFFHNVLDEYGINQNNVYYIFGNNWSLEFQYKNWCKSDNKINIVNSFEQLYLKGSDWFTLGEQPITFAESSRLYSHKDEIRKHKFVCFNRRIRPHRYALIAMLHHNNLLKNNLVSFSLELGKDLNHLGVNRKPDLDTMTRICGKTFLRDTYIDYFDELLKMSPKTIDYENLTNIQGPGFESRHPYESSYFSIVTETAFPEPTYFSTEKIYRPMLHFHPFIVYGSPYTLKNLRELGFKTFSPFIDESYDEVLSSFKRMQLITKEVKRLCSMSLEELNSWYYEMKDILLHNRELMKEYGVLYTESQHKIFEDIYELS